MTHRFSIRQDLTLHARSIGRALRSLGVPGAAALLGLAATAVLALLVTPSWEAQTEELAVQQAQLRRALRAQGPARGTDTPARFLAALPPASERQQRLADLLEIGVRLGLEIQRSEQRLVPDAGAGLERLRVSLPVQGSYAQLRQYLGAALVHDPALSLDSLHLRRSQRESTVLQADLVWTLHSRALPAAGAPAGDARTGGAP
ncbi:GspMb/PilO family protein [Pelomonas sp. APW6]|uniref:GspMb/PilO family protein n=1 Tax=Roseateles subflavus TaxID=3053353 RepID=A0ABT7LDP3_9BURK|nr:GspMb/PilO family protein [Pelomonas sp. APW6]MDL5030981.1 GspMb/PilO family protein [Pelomonas sp. APW6]